MNPKNVWDITHGACNFYSASFSMGGYDLCAAWAAPQGWEASSAIHCAWNQSF